MSIGTFSDRLSFVRRHGFKALGLAVLSAGLFLGGCNNKVKDENEALRKESAELKERMTATETQNTQLQNQLQQTQAEKDQLARDLANAKTQTAMMPPAGGGNWDSGYDNGQPTRRPGRQHSAASERTIEISGDVLFASGSATLKSDAKKELSRILPQLKSASSIRIEGHTDSDPVKKSKYGSNQALSKARADAVRDYLVSRGVPRSSISTVGKGSSEPKGTKAQSRRVDIVVAE